MTRLRPSLPADRQGYGGQARLYRGVKHSGKSALRAKLALARVMRRCRGVAALPVGARIEERVIDTLPPMKRSGGSTQKKKILIVEDEQPLRKALVQVLRRDGYAILEAGDGNDGLKKALQHHPHLVLLDILLPEMDGISMLKLLREDAWGAKVPVIVLTNLADAAHERDALEEKITEFLVKTDWTLRDLASKIRKHLES